MKNEKEKVKPRKFDKSKYDEYVKKFIKLSENRNKTISNKELRKPEFNLPDSRWFIDNCPDNNINTWSKFVDWCGFVAKCYPPSKEKASELIIEKQKKLGRPLMYDDFRNPGCYDVGIPYINKTWGSMNKMKEELGLEIIQESMIDRMLSKEDFDKILESICKYIKEKDKDFITERELISHLEWRNLPALSKYSKKYYKCSFIELLNTKGYRMGKSSCGITYDFEDGEHITSQFEFMFSKFLKNNGFKYNIDYFRDVKYSTFINDYNKHMNCDYVLHINNQIIYIEIAGMLYGYKTWFYNNKEITSSKSKEKYRLKLKQKEQMLKNNGLIYFILFPCDLTNDNLDMILSNNSLELKHNIENFYKNNINWVKVRDIGELDYTNKSIIRNTKT